MDSATGKTRRFTQPPSSRIPATVRLHRRIRLAADADEHAQNLSEWDQTYDQLSRGPFRGSITELWTGKAQVFLESTNRRLRQSCAAWEHSIWFGIPDPAGPTAAIDCHGVPANGIAVRQGGTGFELRTPDDFDIYGIVVDREEFVRYAEEVEQISPDLLLGNSDVLLVDLSAKKRLCQRIDVLLNEANSFENDAQAVQDRILGTLISSLVTQSSDGIIERHARTRKQRWQTVCQIREYLLKEASFDVSVPELCRRFHMSRRTLQYCFEEVTGLSPTAFLRDIRLNGARRDLRRQHRSERTVAQVAMDWGFSHFGEFSRDYRLLFDELPSKVLKAAV